MVYRSDLYVRCTNELAPETFVLLQQIGLFNWIKNLQQTDEYTYFELHDLKWYDGYKYVDAFSRFIFTHEDQIAMIRKGEDNDDIEEYNNPSAVELYYYTSITIDNYDETAAVEKDTLLQQFKQSRPELFI